MILIGKGYRRVTSESLLVKFSGLLKSFTLVILQKIIKVKNLRYVRK